MVIKYLKLDMYVSGTMVLLASTATDSVESHLREHWVWLCTDSYVDAHELRSIPHRPGSVRRQQQ